MPTRSRVWSFCSDCSESVCFIVLMMYVCFVAVYVLFVADAVMFSSRHLHAAGPAETHQVRGPGVADAAQRVRHPQPQADLCPLHDHV